MTHKLKAEEDIIIFTYLQRCGSGMFIPDPNFFHPDPHQRIQKNCF
jgi:hypothetical protein